MKSEGRVLQTKRHDQTPFRMATDCSRMCAQMAKTAAPRKAPKSMAPTEPTLSWNLEGEAALKLLGVEVAEVAVEVPEEVEAVDEPLMVDPNAEVLELAGLVTEAELRTHECGKRTKIEANSRCASRGSSRGRRGRRR